MKQDFGQVPDLVRDDIYKADVAYLRTLADEAIANDPIVGETGAMPVVSDWVNDRVPCMAGECPIGNIFADAIRWKTNADFSFINSGGVRGPGWPQGEVRMSNIWDALPFANSLCTGHMTGLSMFRLFNFSTSVASLSATWSPVGDRLTQVAGVRLTYNTQLEGSRLVGFDIWDQEKGDYVPVERLRLYKFATDSWMCTGFRDFVPYLNQDLVIKEAGEEAGVIGPPILQNVLAEYLGQLEEPYDTSIQGRLVDDTARMTALDWIQTQETCPSGTFWDERYRTCFPCPSTAKVSFVEGLKQEFYGVSGVNDPSSGSIEVENGEDFTVFLTLESKPSWVEFAVPADIDEEIVLAPGETFKLEFRVTTVSLASGTASRTVSFRIVDGGTYPGCIGDTASFDIFVRVDPEPQLNRPGSIRIVGFSLMGVAVFTAFSFAIWVHLNRNHAFVKSMQPFFLISLCAGISIIALAIAPLSAEDYAVPDPGRNPSCMATPWLLSMGFTAVVSTLNAKLWRINKLFENPLRRTTVNLREAMVMFGCTFFINFVLLIVWTLVDPLEWEVRSKEDEEWELHGSCTSSGTAGVVFLSLTCAFDACVLILACYQAIKARQLPETMSESKQLGVALFSWVQILLVGLPVMFLIESDNPNAQYFVIVAVVFVSCMSMLLLIFAPIVAHVRSTLRSGDPQQRASSVHITGLGANGPNSSILFNPNAHGGDSMLFNSNVNGSGSLIFKPQDAKAVAREEAALSTNCVRGSEPSSERLSAPDISAGAMSSSEKVSEQEPISHQSETA